MKSPLETEWFWEEIFCSAGRDPVEHAGVRNTKPTKGAKTIGFFFEGFVLDGNK